MGKRSINKKVNINSFKSFILPAIFAVSLFASVTRVHATEQIPELTPEQQAILEQQLLEQLAEQMLEQQAEQTPEQQAVPEPDQIPGQNPEQQYNQGIGAQANGQNEAMVTGVEITTTTMMYAVKNVNVRKEPNTTSEILGELEQGTNIFAVELTEEGWYRVVYSGETGYIRGDFLAVFGDMDAWSASEPEPELEPEPIAEPDITGAEENVADNQTEDNTEKDGAIENTESDAGKVQEEEQSNGKNNTFTILIIVTLVVVIFVYAVIQIVKDNMNPDEESEEDSEEESGEEDSEDGDYDDEQDDEWEDEDEEEPEDEDPEEEVEIEDLDEKE